MSESHTFKACTIHGCNDPHYAWAECPDCKRLQAEVELLHKELAGARQIGEEFAKLYDESRAQVERLQADYDEAMALLRITTEALHAETMRADDPGIDIGDIGDFLECDHVQCMAVRVFLFAHTVPRGVAG